MNTFKNQNPTKWYEITHKYGYICPECGNHKYFKQFWHIVMNIQCADDTGYVTYSKIDTSNEYLPRIADVICCVCGENAVICKKGILIDTIIHDEHVESFNHIG